MVRLCRLCASLRKIDVLTTVKDNSSEICDKLRKCCQLHITLDDGLPKSICQECISNLNNSHKFYTKVQEAQEILQALYSSQGIKSVHISIQESLAAQEETVTNITKRNKSIEESEQHIKLDNLLFEQSENFVSELNTGNGKELQTSAQDINIGEYAITEILEHIAEIKEDFEEINSSHTNGADQIVEENREEHQAQYGLAISEEKDPQSNEVIQQINDLLSDDETNVEIEYMEYLEDEEEYYVDNDNDIVETFENKRNHMCNSLFANEIKISSWKNYKHLCYICDNIFNTFIDLKEHIVEEHNITQLENLKYKCYDCRKIIARYSFFLNHVRAVHHPDLKLKCDACDLSFQNFDELTNHRSINCIEAKNFVDMSACSYCFKSFNNTYGLQNHVKFQHISLDKVIYKCEQCDKKFQYKSCLKSHQRLHLDLKPFSCDYCDKSFHTKLGLEQHLYTHVDEKAFPCNICNKSYKTFQSLDDHRKLHTEEKSFKCQFCSRVFRRKIQKLTHERSHTGEMPYSCEQCDKKFRYRSALFVHSKIHTGHKPYSCDYCKKTFADSSNRNKHVRRMHLKDKTLENKIK